MNLSCTLHNSARQLSTHPAISWDSGTLSYGEFERQAAGMAGALRGRHGLPTGTRVALAMDNCPEFLPALYAVWRAGLSAVPINSKLHAREMAWIMADAQSSLCLATPKIADALSAPGVGTVPSVLVTGTKDYAALLNGEAVAPQPGDADDEAWMFYTSGTTGRPKGAMLTHRNLLFASHCYYADIDHLGPGRHHPARRAANARLGALCPRPHRAWIQQRHPAGLVRARARVRGTGALRQRQHVRRADHGGAPHQ